MDTHSEIEFDWVLTRLGRNINNLTAEQAIAYIAHKAVTQSEGVYLFGLRAGLSEEHPNLRTSDTLINAGLKRLVIWGMLHPPTQEKKGGQGRPRSVYRRVDTVECMIMLQRLASVWPDAPWNKHENSHV